MPLSHVPVYTIDFAKKSDLIWSQIAYDYADKLQKLTGGLSNNTVSTMLSKTLTAGKFLAKQLGRGELFLYAQRAGVNVDKLLWLQTEMENTVRIFSATAKGVHLMIVELDKPEYKDLLVQYKFTYNEKVLGYGWGLAGVIGCMGIICASTNTTTAIHQNGTLAENWKDWFSFMTYANRSSSLLLKVIKSQLSRDEIREKLQDTRLIQPCTFVIGQLNHNDNHQFILERSRYKCMTAKALFGPVSCTNDDNDPAVRVWNSRTQKSYDEIIEDPVFHKTIVRFKATPTGFEIM